MKKSEPKTSERVLKWRLLLEDYGYEIEYTKGPENVVADAQAGYQSKVILSMILHESS